VGLVEQSALLQRSQVIRKNQLGKALNGRSAGGIGWPALAGFSLRRMACDSGSASA
jgi:hypothetical protein